MYWYIVIECINKKLYPNDHSLNIKEFNESHSINNKKEFVPLEIIS